MVLTERTNGLLSVSSHVLPSMQLLFQSIGRMLRSQVHTSLYRRSSLIWRHLMQLSTTDSVSRLLRLSSTAVSSLSTMRSLLHLLMLSQVFQIFSLQDMRRSSSSVSHTTTVLLRHLTVSTGTTHHTRLVSTRQ